MLRLIKVAPRALAPYGLLFFSMTVPLRLEYSAEERAREEELRQKIQQKYRGMQIPPITNHEYGHFSTMGINETAAQQAKGDAAVQGFGGFGASPLQGRGGVDWIMLFTGCILVYFSGKILLHQMTRGVNDLDMPLWTASIDLQAKHLLFAVQFDEAEQAHLKREFERMRETNPFVSFFEWVQSQKPEFCCGRKYGPDYVMHTLVALLRSNDGTQLATLARCLQKSMRRTSGDSLQRIDDFVDGVQSAAYLLQGTRGTASVNAFLPSYQQQPAYPMPAFVPPPAQSQGAAEVSDLNTALDAKRGEAHSSIPFGDEK